MVYNVLKSLKEWCHINCPEEDIQKNYPCYFCKEETYLKLNKGRPQCFRCYDALKKDIKTDQTMDEVVSLACTEDIPEIIVREHEKHQGYCSVCGQRMDMRVAWLNMVGGECKILCPFCGKGLTNPAAESQLISKRALEGFLQRSKLDQKKAIELIREFTKKYALVKVGENLIYRKYWSWDRGNPILYIIVKGKCISEIGLRGQIKF